MKIFIICVLMYFNLHLIRLFEMGFGEQLNEIIQRLPENRQTLLFSATLPKVLVEFAREGLSDPVLISYKTKNNIMK